MPPRPQLSLALGPPAPSAGRPKLNVNVVASHYSQALNGPHWDEDDEGDEDAPSTNNNAVTELLKVIKGSPTAEKDLEQELSGVAYLKEEFASLSLDSGAESPIDGPGRELSPLSVQSLGKLGEGASGEVHRVRHIRSGLIMAKKTICTSPNPKILKQHLRELQYMRECSHPNIVRYYGAFLEDIGICMEFCEGGSLDKLYKLAKAKQWRTGEKVLGKVAAAILNGLVYLHSLRIIHRDIKPSNILVTNDGQVKLCDFGVSGELINSMAGTFVGTTYYLSPERIRGGRYSITSDVWSAALSVLEVALNRFPFPGPSEPPLSGPIELLTYLVKLNSPSVLLDNDEGVKYTNAFKNFITVCLDQDPVRRPTPQRLLTHPWIERSQKRQPPADLVSWIKELKK